MTKAAYVVAEAKRTAPGHGHLCHWPGCAKECAPAFFMCKPHWATLPREHQARIFLWYRPGQEKSKTPTQNYLEASRMALAWARDYEAKKPKVPTTAPLFGDRA